MSGIIGRLVDLEGVKAKGIDAALIKRPSDVRRILSSGLAATTADYNGAINVWKDDEGFIRCESMAHFRSLEKKRYKSVSWAERWVGRWLKKVK